MKIAIAGAGIGGLTAAMCLHRAGFDVEVFEAVSELRPLGVGATRRLSAVKWGVAGRIVWAWVLTIPLAAAIAALSFVFYRSVEGFIAR